MSSLSASALDRLLLVYDGDCGLVAMLLDVVKRAVDKDVVRIALSGRRESGSSESA